MQLPNLQATSQKKPKSLWKHGAALKHNYLTFEVDKDLVSRHDAQLKDHDTKIGEVLDNTKTKCDWQSLFTHPKLMKSYFWKDQRVYSKQERVSEIKRALNLKSSKRPTLFRSRLMSDSVTQ